MYPTSGSLTFHSNPRPPMTQEEFVSNMRLVPAQGRVICTMMLRHRGMDDGADFPRGFLEDLYTVFA